MNPKIFLSYSHQDAELAGGLRTALERLGAQTFDPSANVRAGDDIRKKIIEGIKKSDFVLLLVSSDAGSFRSWADYEVGSASALDKDVWVMKPNSLSIRDLPINFAGFHTLDFDPKAPDKAAKRLLSSVKAAA